jgi:nucleotide sugar dehydrogenase
MKKRVAIIGLGYVGLPLALLAAKKGYEVIGVVKNPKKAALINNRHSPIQDEKIIEDLQKTTLKATTHYTAIKKASIIIICVPTPVTKNNMPDLDPVLSASTSIAKNLQKEQTVILESTVSPGVCEEIILPVLEKISGLKGGSDFHLVHCPERVSPGDPKWKVENINRIIGGQDKEGLKIATDFYRSILTGKMKQMNSIKEAEACKLVENSFRDINIAFVNELALAFEKLDIDVKNVIDGAATKPFAFMPHYPSCGVGGHCIPVDPYYLIAYAKKNGFSHDFLSLARRVNNSMPEHTASLVVKGLNELKVASNGVKVAVLGLAYKANIDDDRESPAYEVIRHLQEFGADVVCYDPFLLKKSTARSLDEVLGGAIAAVITTDHKEFVALTPEDFIEKGIKVVVDGKNCLPKDVFVKSGLIYRGIGR